MNEMTQITVLHQKKSVTLMFEFETEASAEIFEKVIDVQIADGELRLNFHGVSEVINQRVS